MPFEINEAVDTASVLLNVDSPSGLRIRRKKVERH
jgi:hypothetical protein